MAKKKPRRWRLFKCFQNDSENARRVDARELISWLELKGFKAKVWAPRPEHKTSGHIHVVVLCTFEELCKLGGIPVRIHVSDKLEKGTAIMGSITREEGGKVRLHAVKIVNLHSGRGVHRRVFYGEKRSPK